MENLKKKKGKYGYFTWGRKSIKVSKDIVRTENG